MAHIYEITLQGLNIYAGANYIGQPELFQKSKLNLAILPVKLHQWPQETLRIKFKLHILNWPLLNYSVPFLTFSPWFMLQPYLNPSSSITIS